MGLMTYAAAAALAASPLIGGAALAAAPLADGAVVRVASNLVEAGWQDGADVSPRSPNDVAATARVV